MSVQLFVLGVLAEGPAHGYQLKEVARSWDLGKWAAVGFGSIYHALERLRAEGMVEEARIERQGRRPPRSIYRITATGRDRIAEMVRETCSGVHNPKFPIDLGVAFLRHLPPGERRAVLGERLAGLEELQERVQGKRRALGKVLGTAAEGMPWAAAVLDHDLAIRRTEIQWTKSLLEQVGSWRGKETRRRKHAHSKRG